MQRLLQPVDVGPKSLGAYEAVVGGEAIDRLRALAEPLRNTRVAHLNTTAYGGGVSELLHSVVPLYRALGIECEWLVMPGDPEFFRVTKELHNGLQGKPVELSSKAKQIYLEHNRAVAAALEPDYDVIWVHDPQPAAIPSLSRGNDLRWIWRCHIDTSSPDPVALEFVEQYLEEYDVLVFTLASFVPAFLGDHRIELIAPAIDPLSPKNLPLSSQLTQQILQWSGVYPDRPLISQVSRFDPWKDPLGVIAAYRRIRENVPGVQLALLGQMALDDPEGWSMYDAIVTEAGADPDIHVLTNFTGIGNIEVNAFQSCSDVVLQKSLREGFGLVVSETLWKGTPVVAGRAGGIPLQMPEEVGGYLVDDVDGAVIKTTELLREGSLAHELGARGREHVRAHFLITRLVRDELQLLDSLTRTGRPLAAV